LNEKTKIVIADDEIHILRVLELKFASAGFEVVCAHDGIRAWAEVAAGGPSLLVTDYQMPGMNGVELAEKMFSDDRLSSIPVILLTARGFHLDGDDLSKTNILHVVSKPFSPRELVTMANHILSETPVQGR
jgi:CheY-like chemotaxis protein